MVCVWLCSESYARKHAVVRFNLQQQMVHGHVHHSFSQQERLVCWENSNISAHNMFPWLPRYLSILLHQKLDCIHFSSLFYLSYCNHRVLTSLENLEISGNFVTLENSGNLKCTQGIFGAHYYQRQKCRPMTSFWKYKVHADICGGSLGWGRQTTFDIVQEICQNDCYAVLRWFFTLGFRFTIVWKRLLKWSGKRGKLREFHFAKFVSTLNQFFVCGKIIAMKVVMR